MSNSRVGFIKSVLYGIDGKELPNEQKIDVDGHSYVKGYVKDPDTLAWVPATQSLIKTDNLTVTTAAGAVVSVSHRGWLETA